MENPQPPYISNPFQLIRPSFNAFKLCWLNLLLLVLCAAAAIFVFIGLIVGIVALGKVGSIIALVISVPVVLYLTGSLGWSFTKVTIAASRGQSIKLRVALPKHWTDPFKYLFTGFLASIALLGGLILLVVPGIIFGAWFSAASYITVDEGVWGVAALRRSRDLVRGRTWDVIGTEFLTSCFVILGVIPLAGGIALIVISFILIPVFAIRYISLVELKKRDDWQSVTTSRWNYLVLALGLLSIGVNSAHAPNTAASNQLMLEKNTRPY